MNAATQVAAGLRFAPVLPVWLLAALASLTLLAVAIALWRRARGAPWRGIAAALVLLWLSGPSLVREHRTSLQDIVLLVTDQTESMRVGNRPALLAAAQSGLQRALSALPGVEVRHAVVPPGGDGTRAFAVIDRALAGLPRDRLSAILAVTDGQIDDVAPDSAARLGVPLHVLLTGVGEERDRRLRLIETPGYGVVGKSANLRVVVEDLGPSGEQDLGRTAQVTIRRDGEPPRTQSVTVGRPADVVLPITHEGPSIVELTADTWPGEVSTLNNRAVVQVTGVRDRLRVLLVSGEPHAGERTWRRLLKADPAVDLVHFTILRPPEKDDLTPLNELALIAFPTRELFQQKIREFDLIILDRFQNRGILPLPYLRNIAEYVRDGGGLLVSVGPEFASTASLDQTPLRGVLPARPLVADSDGSSDESTPSGLVTGPFRPGVTALGERHPVTADLPGWQPQGAPTWGRWYRRLAAEEVRGQVVMDAPADTQHSAAPLLVLDRVGTGRVALLLSDQIWLWSRGHDGGGPQAELLRRVAHWLMKQPDLEENTLVAHLEGTDGGGGRMTVERRSTSDSPSPPVTVTDPDGHGQTLTLSNDPVRGIARGETAASMPGVWQVSDGTHTAYAAALSGNTRELADLRATATRLESTVRATGGTLHWLAADPLPELRRVDPGRIAGGRNWLGLPRRNAHATSAVDTLPLLPNWLALALLLGTTVFAWWRESR